MNPFYNDGSYQIMKPHDILAGPPVLLIGTWVLLAAAQLVLCIAA